MREDPVRRDDENAFRNRTAEEAADHEPNGLAYCAVDAAVVFTPSAQLSRTLPLPHGVPVADENHPDRASEGA